MKMIPLNSDSEEALDEYQNYKDNEMNTMRGWAIKLRKARTNIRELQRQYKDILYQNLQEAYQVYIEATQSEYREKFFELVRG